MKMMPILFLPRSCCVQTLALHNPREIVFTSVQMFSTSQSLNNKKPKKLTLKEEVMKKTHKLRSMFVDPEDAHKKPSDLEIMQKDLPANQPTLGERMNRDVYRMFYEADEKHGYHNLRKYPDSFRKEVWEGLKEDLDKDPSKTLK